ncbi:MAG: triacylglycerol lipase [Lachnospiraceae bacterium]|nr:triacylglycerol lipase [Lachnospiraceae bacterium]
MLEDGASLLQLFLSTTVIECVFSISSLIAILVTHIYADSNLGSSYPLVWVRHLIVAFVVELVLFWNGIIRVYLTSVQLGMKWRIIGIICGWIPVAQIYALCRIIRIAGDEALYENEKYLLNLIRAENQECQTRYPILLVHGVFFRDFRFFNYWGRVPAELKRNGADIYYGNQQSAASVARCGEELTARIRDVLKETGCDKVNIIAHSKGGLDSRYAISVCGAADCVASLTTVNTPHRGCIFADYLLNKIPDKVCHSVSSKYNATLKRFGDHDPDFLEAVQDLTASACEGMNDKMPDCPGVYYQSVGTKMNRASSGRFPLNMVYPMVKHFDGDNDGLVSVESMKWGSRFTYLTVPKGRGISHGDMIDLNRENIPGFDVREFYVGLVHNLKEMGY